MVTSCHCKVTFFKTFNELCGSIINFCCQFQVIVLLLSLLLESCMLKCFFQFFLLIVVWWLFLLQNPLVAGCKSLLHWPVSQTTVLYFMQSLHYFPVFIHELLLFFLVNIIKKIVNMCCTLYCYTVLTGSLGCGFSLAWPPWIPTFFWFAY